MTLDWGTTQHEGDQHRGPPLLRYFNIVANMNILFICRQGCVLVLICSRCWRLS
jgi:hypothetical protein